MNCALLYELSLEGNKHLHCVSSLHTHIVIIILSELNCTASDMLKNLI